MKRNGRNWMKSGLMVIGLLAVLSSAGLAFAAKVPPAKAVDVNQASVAELMTIPGLGASKAQAIVTYRSATPFASTADLVNVKGIGEKLLAKIAPYVTVSGANQAQKPGTAEKATR